MASTTDPTTAAPPPRAGDDAPARLSYSLVIERAGDRLAAADVEVCADGWRPRVLAPGVDSAAPFLRTPSAVDDRGRIIIDRADCTRYTVDLAGLVDAHAASPRRQAMRVGETIVLTAGLLLWRPPMRPAGLRSTLRVTLPPGVAISAPWPRSAEGSYRLDESAFRWPSRVVLGAFESLVVAPPGGKTRLDVAVLPGPRRSSADGVIRWLETALEACALAYGRPPAPRVQVIVAPLPWPDASEPVFFGMALRGGGPAVSLLLNALAGDEDLPGEWVAIHELFHLGAPPMAAAAAWLSEGVTMYYSEVLRGRAGHLDERQTWQALYDGFGRGRRGGSGRNLRDESARMTDTGEYLRVYWAGAAIALSWDVALRRASDGAVTLDDAVRHLLDCCQSAERRWSAERVVAELDRRQGSDLLSSLAAPHLSGSAFPDLGDLLERLGVRVDDAGQVILNDDAPEAGTRREITRRRTR